MRILVLSDTHGRPDRIRAALCRRTPPPDILLFLGDGLADLSRCDTADVPVLSVRGNCDVFSFFDAPEERFVSLGGAGIMMMHGHVYRVKSGTGPAVRHAAEAGADILLFGHTHKKYEEFIPAGARLGDVVTKKPLRLFNPGSAGGYSDASFGIIEIRRGEILLSWGEF
ncbi:MAG: YfcE family phosphodiesterase [Eubacteriales bacterium]|jgi:putative phosphoesterase